MASPYLPTEAKRLKSFANFFKSYMSVSAIIVAALPIPFAKLGVIPTYHSQTATFSAYTSLFCFLVLGYVFYIRHQVANVLFSRMLLHPQLTKTIPASKRVANMLKRFTIMILPLLLITASIICFYNYHYLLDDSVTLAKAELLANGMKGQDVAVKFLQDYALKEGRGKVQLSEQFLGAFSSTQPDTKRADILSKYDERIPFAWALLTWYLMMFMTAECAFTIMALKEYLQDLLGIEEITLIHEIKQKGAAA